MKNDLESLKKKAILRHIIRHQGRAPGATVFELDLEADLRSIDPDSKTELHDTSWADVISMNDTADERSIADVFESACSGVT
ncbi:MAG: hypothetical protein H7Z17_13105 [Fuerstia sp.]|nr:hypothetical protein [Fuerstiella sp.]